MPEYREIPGAVTAPRGFKAAAVHCGIKQQAEDLALIVSDCPAAAAATVTTNTFRAAPTFVTQEAVSNGIAQVIVANSGCANAATGEQGMSDARTMARLAAEATGVAAEDVIVCSTGIIGRRLPMDKVAEGIKQAAQRLTYEGGEEAARGIMTTDTAPKLVAVEFEVAGVTCRLGGICKGAGMICPQMATMLCFLTTDAAIEAPLLRSALLAAVEHSFNCITVDGDMSTNDTVAILANAQAGNRPLAAADDEGYFAFRQALDFVTQTLAKKIAADGEGCSKFIEIVVTGAQSWEQARMVGRAVANYNLFKTAIYGGDFNWGRIAAALGSSKVPVDPAAVTIRLQGITAWQGRPVELDMKECRSALEGRQVSVEIDLGLGQATARVWTCDLTPDYVHSNAAYEVPESQGD